ncbi:MAG TPA: RelA/SpoT domain-containing protein [Conexibacter sp.]|nr:RelA/SpoT domain-containing protein [Conexibacter sp.]
MARYQDPFKPKPGETFSKRQVDRAGETLREFYRWQPGTELHLRLSEVSSAFATVTWWRTLHAHPLSKVATNLRYHVVREGALVDGRVSVTQRLKRTVTIGDKLTRELTMDVTQMQDVGGVRACMPSLEQVHAVSRRLRKSWTIVRTRDYIADPKPSGYRALHHIVRRDGRFIEVQLRTTLQDEWANQVEDDGHETGVGLKFGRGSDAANAYYDLVSRTFALVEHHREIPEALVKELQIAYERIKDHLPGESG